MPPFVRTLTSWGATRVNKTRPKEGPRGSQEGGDSREELLIAEGRTPTSEQKLQVGPLLNQDRPEGSRGQSLQDHMPRGSSPSPASPHKRVPVSAVPAQEPGASGFILGGRVGNLPVI